MSILDDDAEVHDLLQDAVSDVEPRPALMTIRVRTAARRRRPWLLGGAAAVVATVATVGAVVGTGSSLSSGTRRGPAGATEGRAVIVYFTGSTGAGPRLFPERHRVAAGQSGLEAAVEAAVAGAADDPDYGTPWPAGTSVAGVRLAAGVLSVDLTGGARRPAGMDAARARLALQQVIFTARSAVHRTVPVRFLLDGGRTGTLLGVPTARPVSAGSAGAVLSPVSVTSPTEDATVSSPVTVRGRTAASERTVGWELRRGASVVRHGVATARECCTQSPYSFRVAAPAGRYTLVVRGADSSRGKGNRPTQDTKHLTIH